MASKYEPIVLEPTTKVRRGHSAHRGGAGTHGDRRTKRLRTRSARNRQAISSY